MKLLDRKMFKSIIKKLDGRLQEETRLLLVGGSAVVVLCEDAEATKDLDAFPTENLNRILDAVKDESSMEFVDINTMSSSFEPYLPEDWESRVLHSSDFSGKYLQIFTPCPEDLAVMKVFRYVAKDAEDIEKLARLKTFDRDAFRKKIHSPAADSNRSTDMARTIICDDMESSLSGNADGIGRAASRDASTAALKAICSSGATIPVWKWTWSRRRRKSANRFKSNPAL